jgi:hypothetical protein
VHPEFFFWFLLCIRPSGVMVNNPYWHVLPPVTGRSYIILGNFSCKTNNCIYLISCDVCHKQCKGETTDLRKRINNHRSSIRTKKDLPVATHFNGNNHRWEYHFKWPTTRTWQLLCQIFGKTCPFFKTAKRLQERHYVQYNIYNNTIKRYKRMKLYIATFWIRMQTKLCTNNPINRD